MKYVDEFRDPQKAQSLLRAIAALLEEIEICQERPLQIMEVCGGHTHAIFRYGIESLLPAQIELVHGPGCPVCVLPRGRVDDCVALAATSNVIFTTFGDALRVRGSQNSLLDAKAAGADVRMVYSPLDALQMARDHPQQEVIFLALGFETTMPSTALTVLQAEREGIRNFSLFCNHITIIPTIQAVLDSPQLGLDGLIGPGHVSMVIGNRPYEFIAERYHRPVVISGFEPLDILQSLWMVLKQLAAGRCVVENQYNRVVSDQGNAAALAAMDKVFELRERF
jgi:hydrogenase expression/formation protein HypD